MKYFFLFATGVAILAGCKSEDREPCAFTPETDASAIDLRWEALENQLPAVNSKKELIAFFSHEPVLRDEFFHRASYPDDSVFINDLYQRFTNPHLDTLLTEVHRVFGDGSTLKKQFAEAFAIMKYYYPDFQPPRIQTVLTGLESDLYVSDSLVIVGLDHYLGAGSRYELKHLYEYMRRRYTPDFIVPSVMLLFGIDSHYNQINPSDRTVLADMVAYGKAYHFAKLTNPCVPDSVLIGYTAEEMSGSRSNESLIWSRFVEDQVLFSTSGPDRQRYINERPKTIEVGEKCPGRIGQWVGWQIVRQYAANHPDEPLSQIMQMKDASALFNQSGYKPQIVKVPGKKRI